MFSLICPWTNGWANNRGASDLKRHRAHYDVTVMRNSRAEQRMMTSSFSALLAICARNSPVNGEFPSQRPVTRSFDVFYDLRLNKRLSKQVWGWWFETLLRPLWRHCNEDKKINQDIDQKLIWVHGKKTTSETILNDNGNTLIKENDVRREWTYCYKNSYTWLIITIIYILGKVIPFGITEIHDILRSNYNILTKPRRTVPNWKEATYKVKRHGM